MILTQTETYQEMCRRQVTQKAKRYAEYGNWQIKSPKKVLRCDICEKYKKKQAVYARWQTQELLCDAHVPRNGL